MENNNLTDSKVHDIYNTLAPLDADSTNKLNDAHNETLNMDDASTEEMKVDDAIPGVDAIPDNMSSKSISDDNIKDTLSNYDLSDEDTLTMVNIINDYMDGNTENLYEKLPKDFKYSIDNIVANFSNISKEKATKFVLDELIHDSSLSEVFDEYNYSIQETLNNMNKEYASIMNEAFNETFNKIEELEVSDPEKAEKIKSIKIAFEESTTFNKQLEFLNNVSKNKLNKWYKRYEYEVEYFNTRVKNNIAKIKLPNVSLLSDIISSALPQYKKDEINKFILIICKSSYKLDMNNIIDISYLYKMICSIYNYRYTLIDEKGEVIFSNISKVIEKIISL